MPHDYTGVLLKLPVWPLFETVSIEDTVHNWLKEVAPERARKPGNRDKQTRNEQERICKDLGIGL